jgi:hypothetical protein
MSFWFGAWVFVWGFCYFGPPPKKSSNATTLLVYCFGFDVLVVVPVVQKELAAIVSCLVFELSVDTLWTRGGAWDKFAF